MDYDQWDMINAFRDFWTTLKGCCRGSATSRIIVALAMGINVAIILYL